MIKITYTLFSTFFFKFPQQSSYNNCFFSESTYLYAVIIIYVETKSANLIHLRSFIHVIWCSFITYMGYILSLIGAIDNYYPFLVGFPVIMGLFCGKFRIQSFSPADIWCRNSRSSLILLSCIFFTYSYNSAPTPNKTTERTSTHPQGFLGYLFFSILATACNYWCQFSGYCKHLTNLVNADWLWRISLGIWANQKLRNILNK